MSWTDLFKDLGFGFQVGGQIAGVFGSYSKARVSQQQSDAQKMANEAQAAVAENNAQLATWQAMDALYRGAVDENRVRVGTAQLKGTQRARFAASGVTLDGDSVARTLTDTDVLGELDAETARYNAEREAWAQRQQAQDFRNRAEILRKATVPVPDSTSGALIGSLLAGAGNVAQSWYRWKN